ncbi:MAG: ferredoxin [Zestosphaera tikiterensis]|uniref:Ferredoxin n=1 Tax=Zestosphaera tikiterensis TaxID=1973259 RepID=A0A2R7Y4N0_9CREN|nr:MAG: ferredoxin [Zestosphaera tikiterensis]
MATHTPNYRKTGVITVEELKKLNQIPTEERMSKGPAVVIECPEPIPCNICVSACPFKAIWMESIIDLPKVDWSKCVGCGVCVALCPGLAIFVVDLSKPDKAYVTVPHEFLPAPKAGDEVILLNRYGERVGKGKVVKVWERNKTYVVTVEAPKELALEVRAIWVEK